MRPMLIVATILALFIGCHSPAGAAAPQAVNIADGLSDAVLQKVKDATVFITSTYSVTVGDKEYKPGATGSGFVIDSSGLIVTNRHVVDCGKMFGSESARPDLLALGQLVSVTVRTHSGTAAGKEYPARLVAMYELPYDLALLRIEPEKPLTALELGDEAALKETRKVWAAGFPRGNDMDEQLRMVKLARNPNGPDLSIRGGEVTALRRDDQNRIKAIETSCQFEPGNSGGPLIDETGKVFGINTYLVYESRVSLPVRHIHMQLGALVNNMSREPAGKVLKVEAAGENSFSSLWKSRKAGEAIEFGEGEFTLDGEELVISGRVVIRGVGRGKSKVVLRSGLRFKLEKGATLEICGLNFSIVRPSGEQPRATIELSSSGFGHAFISNCTLINPPKRNALCGIGNVRAMVCDSTVYGFECPKADDAVLRLARCEIGSGTGHNTGMELDAGKYALFGCSLPRLELAASATEKLVVALAGCRVINSSGAVQRGTSALPGVRVLTGRLIATECEFHCIGVGGDYEPANISCSRCLFTSGTSKLDANAIAEFRGCLFKTELPVAIDCLGEDDEENIPGADVTVEACRFELSLWSDGLSADAKRKRAEQCCFGIEIAATTNVSWRGNLFVSDEGGIGVRLAAGADDKDGGENQIVGPGTLKKKS
ncbi:MAG: trypsin-like peptidase domain-containing protein [Planctomycetes bacterium]|nr:trypsin-like peptidase domain-containing protein [Planctomycetota bacterium]